MVARDIMEYDVVIVGGGPSGLSSAIKLRQIAIANNQELSVCLLEKGSAIGSHIISGCVFNPMVLDKLIPEWRELNFGITNPVLSEEFLYLSSNRSYKLPLHKSLKNHGNYIISLSNLCRELATYAENLGVEIYPGFSCSDYIVEDNRLTALITSDMGVNRDGSHSDNYQAGVEIRAQQFILAEGSRGSISKRIIREFDLDHDCQPQTYGLGFKEIWQVKPEHHVAGQMIHTIGYPLDTGSYGGGFLYNLENNKVAVGFIPALDYQNSELNPYEEFQRFKLHPRITGVLEGGTRLEYGARTVVEGGVLTQPKLTFAGGVIVGDSAGFLNIPKVKGVHNAMESGILAATGVYTALQENQNEATLYAELYKASWLYNDLYQVRNIRPSFQYGLLFGLCYSALELYVLKGKLPFNFKFKHTDAKSFRYSKVINYPVHDNKITFSIAASLHLANLYYEDQPIHLILKDSNIPIEYNLAKYNAPETRYCPAGVYEIVTHQDKSKTLLINASNCLQCKACDIKDPTSNITWTTPQGGSGPQYSEL